MKLSNINSCVRAQSLSLVQLFETLWIVAYKAPLYVGFLRQEYWSAKLKKKKKKYWSALPFPAVPALGGRFFTTEPSGKSSHNCYRIYINKRIWGVEINYSPIKIKKEFEREEYSVTLFKTHGDDKKQTNS